MDPDYVSLVPHNKKVIFQKKTKQLVTIPLPISENTYNDEQSCARKHKKALIYTTWTIILILLCLSIVYVIIYALVLESTSTNCSNFTGTVLDNNSHEKSTADFKLVENTTQIFTFNDLVQHFEKSRHKISKRFKRSPTPLEILEMEIKENCQLDSHTKLCVDLINRLEGLEKEISKGISDTFNSFKNQTEYSNWKNKNEVVDQTKERTADDGVDIKNDLADFQSPKIENVEVTTQPKGSDFDSFTIPKPDTSNSDIPEEFINDLPKDNIAIESIPRGIGRLNVKDQPGLKSLSVEGDSSKEFSSDFTQPEYKQENSASEISLIFVTESSSKISIQTDLNITENPFHGDSFKSNTDAETDIERKALNNPQSFVDHVSLENKQIPESSSNMNLHTDKIFSETHNDDFRFKENTNMEAGSFETNAMNTPQTFSDDELLENRQISESNTQLTFESDHSFIENPIDEVRFKSNSDSKSLINEENEHNSDEDNHPKSILFSGHNLNTERPEKFHTTDEPEEIHDDVIKNLATDNPSQITPHSLNFDDRHTTSRVLPLKSPIEPNDFEGKTLHNIQSEESLKEHQNSFGPTFSEQHDDFNPLRPPSDLKSLSHQDNPPEFPIEPLVFDFSGPHRSPSIEWLQEHGFLPFFRTHNNFDFESHHHASSIDSQVEHEFLPAELSSPHHFDNGETHHTPSEEWLREHGMFQATPQPNGFHSNNDEENHLSNDNGATARIVSNIDDRFLSPKPNSLDEGNVHSAVTSESMKAVTQTIHSTDSQIVPLCFYGVANSDGQISSPAGFVPFQPSKDQIATFQGITPRNNEFTGHGVSPYQFTSFPGQPYPYQQYSYSPPQSFPPQYPMNIPQSQFPSMNNFQHNGKPMSFIIPSGSQMPPQQQPYICYMNPAQLHGSYTPGVSDFRTVPSISPAKDDDSESDAYSNDDHFSVHYRNAQMLADKTYGNHSFPSGRSAESCSDGQKTCASTGNCIDKINWCDGVVQCADGSDESSCPCRARVDKSRICDGFYDCPMGEEEMGCFNCGPLSFSCNDWSSSASRSTCFTIHQRCDGVSDCKNKIDEHECTMLHSSLDHHAIVEISHSKGFLHRNYRGKWYPVCNNPYKWAMQACIMEVEGFRSSPLIQLVEKPKNFKGKFIQETLNGEEQFVGDCFNGSAVFVTCPHLKCGSTSEIFSQTLREVSEHDELFSRSKRQIHTDPVIQIGAFTEDENHNPYISIVNTIHGHDEHYGNIVPPYQEIGPMQYANNHLPYVANTLEYPEAQNNYQNINPYDKHNNGRDNVPNYYNVDENTLYYNNLHNSFSPHEEQSPEHYQNPVNYQAKPGKRYADDNYQPEFQQQQYEQQLHAYESDFSSIGYFENDEKHENIDQNIQHNDKNNEPHKNAINNPIQYRSSDDDSNSFMTYGEGSYQVNAPGGIYNSISSENNDRTQKGYDTHSQARASEDQDNVNIGKGHKKGENSDRKENVSSESDKFKEDIVHKNVKNVLEESSNSADVNKKLDKNNSTTARDKRGEARVVGGRMSSPAAWPWVVAINKDGIYTCGGTLISNMWIMTAAHCTVSYWQHFYEIQVGILRRLSYSPQEQRIPVGIVVPHPEFNRNTMYNDIALMKLQRPVVFNRWVRPACLPSEESAGSSWLWGPQPKTMCTTIGWGSMEERGPDPDHLHEVDIPIMAHCKTKLDEEGLELCAGFSQGGHDACQGDSGGPMLCKNPHNSKQWYVAGIVGHGEGCARANEPGVYTRVSLYIDWIKENTEGDIFPSKKPKQKCPGFSCKWGTQRCLPKKRQCDTIVDCLAGEDEINCEEKYKLLRVSDPDESNGDLEMKSFSNEDYFERDNVFEDMNTDYRVQSIHLIPKNESEEIESNTEEPSQNFRSNQLDNSSESLINKSRSSIGIHDSTIIEPVSNLTKQFRANENINSTILSEVPNQNSTIIQPKLFVDENKNDLSKSLVGNISITTESINILPLIVQPDILIEMDKLNNNDPSQGILEINNKNTTDGLAKSLEHFTPIPLLLEKNTTANIDEEIPENFKQTTFNPVSHFVSPTNFTQLPQRSPKSLEHEKDLDFNITPTESFHSGKVNPEPFTTKTIVFDNKSEQMTTTSSPLKNNSHTAAPSSFTIKKLPPAIEEEKFLPLHNDASENGDNLDPTFSGDHGIPSHIDKKELDIDETKFTPLDRDRILLASEEEKKIEEFIRRIRYPQHQTNFPVNEKFQCKRMIQEVPIWKKCDRISDCEDGSDEWGCSCHDYLIYNHPHLICDGYVDCNDGMDEKTNCSSCSPNQSQCRVSKTCIPKEKVCDKIRDCEFGEDELDCFTLFGGHEINIDMDSRPHHNPDGILAVMQKGVWETVCDHAWTPEKKHSTAEHICNYLGFSGYEQYKEALINKDNTIIEFSQKIEPHVLPVFRHSADVMTLKQKGTVHQRHLQHNFTMKMTSHTIRPLAHQEKCVGLHVTCQQSVATNISSHFLPNKIFGDVIQQNIMANEVQDLYLWPWVGKLYSDGIYTCAGVLIDYSWLIVEKVCWTELKLNHKYVTVVVGSKRSIPDIDGPYEQIIKIDGEKHISFSNIILLHLQTPAYHSRYVKPVPIPDFDMTAVNEDNVCLIAAIDDHGGSVSIFLEPFVGDCGINTRCFKRTHFPKYCESLDYRHQFLDLAAWSGIVVCHRHGGWYPAATYSDPEGACGFRDHITALPNIAHRKDDIFIALANQIPNRIPEIRCSGARCQLGQCIPPIKVCDGIADCRDRFDEGQEHCNFKQNFCSNSPFHPDCGCAASQIKCANGKCIPKIFFANHDNDCGDRSDEPETPNCLAYLLLSDAMKVCDGVTHCKDMSDEDPHYCKCFARNTYKCDDTDFCIPYDAVCDGFNHCPHGDDEQGCTALSSENDFGVGEVMEQNNGIWHTKCYDRNNYTKNQLEDICRQMGFTSGHAAMMTRSHEQFFERPVTKVVLDPFVDVTFQRGSISLRNNNNPYATEQRLEDNVVCHRLYVECI